MDSYEIIVGFILGCLSLCAISIIRNMAFIPKIHFANDICKFLDPKNNGKWVYKIKFRNVGKRDVFDMHLFCTLYIPDLETVNSIHKISLNLGYDFTPLFKVRKRKGKINPDGLVRIRLNDEHMHKEFVRTMYPKDINNKATKGLLTLEDLLLISPSSYIMFYIIAHDKLSGRKKIYESPSYTIENIKQGIYKHGELYIVD